MSVLMILKIFSDCCICFALLASGPVDFSLPLLIPALICGISAGIGSFFGQKNWTFFRILSAVLPFISLIWAKSTGETLVFAIPAAYTALVILRNRLDLEYYGYRRFFISSLFVLGGAYTLLNVWIFLSQITNDVAPILSPEEILRYGLVHLLCGIVLQRQLRLGVGHKAEGNRRQLAVLLATGGAIGVGFVAAEPLLRKGAGWLLRTIVTLLLTPFLLLYELIAKFLEVIKDWGGEEKSWENFLDKMAEQLNPGGEQFWGPQEPPVQQELDPTTIWIVLISIVLLILGIILLRSFLKSRADAGNQEIVTRLPPPPKKKKTPPLSNRNRVRQIYRDFLRTENGRGLKLKCSDTSADVQNRLHPNTNAQSAADLRQIYLKARYDDRHSISRSQLEQAKQALRGTRQQKV
jgi:hypothetical protein